MYLLDSNHCGRVITGDIDVLRAVTERGNASVGTSSIVAGELVFMAGKSERRDVNLARVRRFLDQIRIYFVDRRTADVYGDLKADLLDRYGPRERKKRRQFDLAQLGFTDNDLWIAATVLQHGLTLVSADGDFVRIRDMHFFPLETWWKPPAPPGVPPSPLQKVNLARADHVGRNDPCPCGSGQKYKKCCLLKEQAAG